MTAIPGAAPTQAAIIQSVQRGSSNIGASQNTLAVGLTPVDPTRTIVWGGIPWGGGRANSNAPNVTRVGFDLANSTTLNLQRLGSPGTAADVEWQAIEFASGVTVQRGVSAFGTTTTTVNVPITAVTLSETFVLISVAANTTSATIDEEWTIRAQLTTSTNLALTRLESGIALDVYWQVVSYTGASVQRGLTTLANGVASVTAAITSVDPGTTFLLMNSRGASQNNGIESRYQLRGRITSATQLTFDRISTSNAQNISWEVVSLNDGSSVQSGNIALGTAATSGSATLTSVNTSNTATFISVRGGTGTSTTTLDETSVTHTLGSSTSLNVQRAATGTAADVSYFAVEFPANQPPVLASIGPQNVAEGGHLEFRVSATDPEATTPTLSAAGVPANATFTDSLNGAGALVFDPDYTQAGVINVTVIASDGTLADSEVVAITVSNTNRAPVLAAIGPKNVAEGAHLEFRVSSSDPDATTPSLSAIGVPANAIFTDSLNGAGSLIFDPDYSQAGVINITVIASDGALADSEVVAITVTNTNQPPVLNTIGPQNVAEGAHLEFRVSSTDGDGTTPGLSAVGVPANATFTDSLNGAGSLVFDPDYTQSGVINVTFIASDGSLADSEVVAITVTNTNRAPVLAAIGPQNVAEGGHLEFRVSATDPDGSTPTFAAVGVPANATFTDSLNGAGSLVFDPDFSQAGVINVTVIAGDGGLADSEAVAITVTNTNVAPVLAVIGPKNVAEGAHLEFRVSASDLDGTTPSLTAVGLPVNAVFTDSLNGAGSLVFDPDYTQAGVFNVTFIAGDGSLADSEVVAITVTNTNRAPVLATIGPKNVAEGGHLEFGTSATDPDGTTPVLSAVGVPANATFTDSLNGAGSLIFDPDFNQSGVINVTIIAGDGALADSEIVAITVTNTNRAPLLNPIGGKNVAEGGHLEFRISGNDPDATTPILSAVNVPANATFTDSLNGAASLVFDPDYTQAGVINVTFVASDGSLADSEVVAITVANTNLAPVLAAIGPQSVAEGAHLEFRVSATDPDGSTPVLTALNVPANATFTDSLNGAGSLVFDPNFSQAGVYNVTFIAEDGALADSEIVAITVTGTNLDPVLDPIGGKNVAEGGHLEFRVSASDPDGNTPSLSAVGVPANAVFSDSLNGAGSFVFDPDFTQEGVHNVTVIASDGLAADTEIVAITVANTNLAPVLAAIGPKSVAEGAHLEFRLSASDFDGTTPSLSASGVPANATFMDSLNGAGSLVFDPDFSQEGVFNVTFVASDGALADTEVVAITVTNTNRVPILAAIGAKNVAEAGHLEFRTSATDPDGTTPILSAVGVPANATFTDSLNGAGSLVFDPDYTQSGVINVTFIASDGSLADSEVVAITVTNTNRAPVLAAIGPQNVAEGAHLEFRVSSSDPDATTPVLTAVGTPANATFTDSLNGAGSLVFDPDFSQAGVVNLTVIATDGALADTEVVAITVTNTNVAPVLAAIGPKNVAEGAHLEFRVSASDFDGTTPSLSAVNVPANAVFTDSLNGAGSLVFDPDFTQEGVYNVTFIAGDGSFADSEVVAITVTNTNRAPVLATIGAKNVAEGGHLEFRTSATDPDGTTPVLSAVGVPANATFTDSLNGAGSLVFDPDYTQAGVFNVTIIASDGGLADSEVVAITVTNTNLAPVLAAIGPKNVAEGSHLEFRVSASDFDGTTPALSAAGVPANAVFTDSLNGAGSLVFDPDYTQAGVVNVTFVASDGALADTEIVAITVTNTNRPPVLAPIGAQNVAEAGHLEFRTSATDPDGTTPILSAVGAPANATFTDSLNGAGSLIFDPDYTQAGVYSVTFIASDGTLADSEIVAITVTNTNRTPVLAAIGPQTVAEGAHLEFRISSSDPDATIPILSAVGVPANAAFTDSLNGVGSLIFDPDFSQAGVVNLTVIATDGALADTEVVAITVTNTNVAPVLAAIGSKNVAEGAHLEFRVSASDFDGTTPSLSAVGVPANAVFTDSLNGAGSLVFDPDYTQAGLFNVTFIAGDGSLADSEVVAITVTNTNRAPVLAAIGPKNVAEGGHLEFRTSATDPDGTTPTLSAVGVPANATFTDSLNGAGSLVFDPDFTQAGVFNVTIIASDGGLADSEVVAITVTNTNLAPVLASIGAKNVAEGGHLEFRTSATDPDGTTPVLSAVGVPANATFTDSLNGAGSLVFDPDYTQSGVYNVTFIASDGSLADSEVVAITVTNTNLTPVLAPIGAKNVAEAAHHEFRVSANDPDGTTPILSAVGVPANATFTDSLNGASSLVFDPDFTQAGVYNVTFIASDGALADSEVVAITVTNTNRVPVLAAIGPQSVAEGGHLEFRTSASDPDGTTPVLSAVGVPANATFTDSLNGAGSLVFDPDYTQAGVFNVTFVASDGSLADTEIVAITVTNTNLAPVLAAIGPKNVAEGAHLEFRVSASDFDGTTPSLSAVGVPANAVFTDSLNGAGSLVFDPDFSQVGVYNVTIVASDGSLADTEVVAITVTNTNRAPVLAAIGPQNVPEGGHLEFRTSATDPDGTTPTLSAVGVPANATFTDSLNGAGSLVFDPDFTQAGVFNVTFIAADGSLADSEVVAITVTNTNLAPALAPIGAKSVAEGGHLEFRTSATDSDGTTPVLSAVNVPANATFTDSLNGAGSLTFDPDFTQEGVYNVTFIASDGTLADSEVVAITVTNTNLAPVLDPIGAKNVAEAGHLEFRTSASDPDGTTPVLSAVNVPANATFTDSLNGAGSLVFDPDFTQEGVYNVTFIASDGTLADSEVVAITVTNTNRAPVLATIGAKNVAEGGHLEFRTSATDPDGTTPILSAVGVPANATFTDSLNGAGSLVFDPNFTQAGVYNVTFFASDGTLADSEVVAITVTNTNLAPVLDPIGAKSVAEGGHLEFRLTASDPDGTTPVLSAVNVPANAIFTDSLNGAGSLVFDPDFTQEGIYNLTFVAGDGALADSEVVAITVTGTNLPPVLDPIGAKSVAEGGHLEFRLTASDPDVTIPALSAVNVPANAIFTDSLNGAGSLVFDPDFTQAGIYNVTFIASDGSLADSEVVAITVTNTNLAPVLDPIGAKNVAEGGHLEFRLTSSDPDGTTPVLSALNVPANATFTDSLNGAGSLVFDPNYTQSGVYNVTFIASDGSLADSEIVAITVTNTNRAPVLAAIGPKSVAEGASLSFRLSASDPDATIPSFTAVNVPANATLTDSLNGAAGFVFNPTVTQEGVYDVTFITSDGTLADSEVVSITVTHTNVAPVLATIGNKTVTEGVTLSFRVSATDLDLDPLTFQTSLLPSNAAFVDSGNGAGSFTFTPSFTQAGTYFITFIVDDTAGGTDDELVRITVNEAGNQRPVLAAIGPKNVAEAGHLEFKVTATDAETTPSLSAVGLPANATFVDSLNGRGGFVFDPNYTQSGVYNVTFIASDGSLADSEVVAITVTNVNRAPVLAAIGPKSVAEGAHLEFRISGSDPDATIPSLNAVGVPANATFTDSLNGAGSLVFDPDFTQAGVYNVTFIASDGSLTDSEVVAITVTGTNLSPVLDPIGAKNVAENAHLEFRVSGSDPDGTTPSLSAVNLPANASFTDSLNGAGALLFDPDFTQAGVHNVTFIASDGLSADSEVVAITVTNTNRPPVLDPIGPKSVAEGAHLEFRLSSSDPDGATPVLTALNVPTNATFTDSLNGAGSFVFDPDFTQGGVYNVTFVASDGSLADTEIVAITVSNTNRPPVLAAIGPKTVAENASLQFQVTSTDPDLQTPALTAVGLPANATLVDSLNGRGGFFFNPNFTQEGVYNVTIIASDGTLADSEVVAITVTRTNQPPVLAAIGTRAVNEGDTLEFRVSATDPDLDPLTLFTSVLPANAAFVDSGNGAGSFRFTPSFTQSGTFFVTFAAQDTAGAIDNELVRIDVLEGGNQPPVLNAIGAKNVAEGAHLEFRVTSSDPEGSTPILSAAGIPANASFVDSLNGRGAFFFDPDFTQAGVINVTFIASDGALADSEVVAITVSNVNLPPVLNAIGPQSVAENAHLEFRVSSSDPDAQTPSLSALNVPANAVFTDSLNGAGSFVFDPDFSQAGVFNVTFIASDGVLADTEVAAITVTNTNRAPVLAPIGAKNVAEGAHLEFRASASDPDATTPALSAVNVPANATFTDSLNGAGSLVFDPDFTQAGVYNVTIIASDGALADSEVVAITVGESNLPPVLNPIGPKSVAEGNHLEFRISSSDPDGTTPGLSAVNVPLNATFTDSLNGAGSLVFDPDFTQAGVFNVTFIAGDGSLADSEVVAITVTNVNRPPVLDPIGAKSVAEGDHLEFRVSSSDPDGAVPVLTALGVPLNATFTDSTNGAGSLVFDPDFSQAGVYNVTFIASDGSLADTEIVAITVTGTNLSPVLDPIGPQSVAENAHLEFRVSGSDPDGTTPSLSAVGVPANAVFTDSLNGAGSLVFDPDFTQAGVFNVTFIATDGLLADSEVVAITVTNTNRAPVLAAIGPKSVAEAAHLEFRVSSSDPDGAIPTLSATGVPANAVFVDSLNGAGSLVFDPDYFQAGVHNVTIVASDGALADSEVVAITVTNVNRAPVLAAIGPKTVAENAHLEFRVTASDVDLETPSLTAIGLPVNSTFVDSLNGRGGFVFDPNYTQEGVYNVTFIASDGSLADSEVVAITVTRTNQLPVLDPIGNKSVNEGGTLAFRVHATDLDLDPLTLFTSVLPSNAVFVDSGNGAGSLTFTPNFTQSGTYFVTFVVEDTAGGADNELVRIDVLEIGNQRPVLDSIGPKTVAEDAHLEFRVRATDAEGTTPILTAAGLPTNASFVDSLNGRGGFFFDPDFTQAGVHNVTFIASDGSLADSEVVAITVTNVNRAPVLAAIGPKSVAEGAHLEFRLAGSDPDGTTPVLTAVGVPVNATFTDSLNGAGSFVFDPDFTQAGVYNVTFVASDGVLADTEIVAVTVTGTNLAPVLDPIGAQNVAENAHLEFRVSGSDPDGTTPSLSAVNVPANAVFTDSLNGAGSFVFDPDFTQAGVYNITFIASDGGLADTEIVAITVANVNLPPVLNPIGAQNVAEGAHLEFRVSGNDPDAQIPALSALNVPANATFTDSLNGAGSLLFDPDFTQEGVYNVTFIASDGSLADTEVVAITVSNTNRPPVLDPIGAQSVAEGGHLEFRVSGSDPDGSIPILSAVNPPANAVFTDSSNGAGSFVFDPDFSQAGVYNVVFISSDGALADTEIVAITVTGTNLAPVLDPIGAKNIAEGAHLEFRVSSSDPDGFIPSLSALNVPPNATFTDSLNGAGSFVFDPDFTQAAVYNVTFIASDGLLSDTEIVAITVTNTNRPPVLDPIGPQSVVEAAHLEFRVSSSDPDGATPVLTAVGVPTNAAFVDSLNGAGSFVFDPDYFQAGVHNITFIASDGGLADTEVVAITVTNNNRPPTLNPIGPKTVAENASLQFQLVSTDPDLEIPALTAVGLPPNATLVDSLNGRGGFFFNPNFTQEGVYNVTFIASDGGLADSEVVTITVTRTNQAPILDPIGTKSVAEGTTLSFRVHAVDPDLDPLTLFTSVLPSNAAFVDSGNGAGSLTFSPSFTQSGTYFVTFVAEDTAAAQDNELVRIDVIDAGNQRPVLAPIGPKSVAENAHLEFRVSATDADATTPILIAAGLPANASFVDSLNGRGALFFDPDFTQAGVHSVTIIASDGALADSEVVAITVTNVNRPPALDPIGAKSVAEGDHLEFRVSSSDPDGAVPVLTALGVPLNATFTDSTNGAGSLVFDPDFSQAGVYNVTFIASDGSLADTEIVAITVTGTNLAPVLDPIGPQSVAENAHLEFRVSGSDPDGTTPSLSAVGVPANAVFTDSLNGAGSLVFDPDFTQAGGFNVTFIATDGLLADSEVVAITVTNTNRAPVLAAIGPKSVAEAAHLEFRVSSSDPDGAIPSLSATGVPANAVFVDSLNGAGSLVFDPDYFQAGVYNVTIVASDGALADSEVVAITVTNTDRPPVLDPIGPKTVAEGASLQFRVTSSDPDLEIPTLAAVGLPANASFVDSLNGRGGFFFNPNFTQEGNYNVTLIASDGLLADSETVSITVTHTNQAPILDPIGSKSVIEGNVLSFRVHAVDLDLDPLTLFTSVLPSNAVFVDSGNGAGSLTFSPSFTQAGTYFVTFAVEDTNAATDNELVRIDVFEAGNQRPVLDSIGPKTVAENAHLEFRVRATDAEGTTPILTAAGLPANASFVDSLNGRGGFFFDPGFTQAGVYNVTFIASDGSLADSEAVAITVTNVNRAPVLASIGPKSVAENAHLEFRISASDPDLQVPSLSALNVPTNAVFTDSLNGAGSLLFDPDFTQEGVYNVTFIASDGGLADTEIVAITVTNTNRPPVLAAIGPQTVAENAHLEFRASASDPDGFIPALSAAGLPANAAFADSGNGAGGFTFDPDFTQSGVYNITIIASDGDLADSEVVAVTVTNVNRAPVLDPIGAQAVAEGDHLEFRVTANDPDGATPALTALAVPANAAFNDSLNGAGGFVFDPDYTQAGLYNVTFIASDGTLADTEIVAITVSGTNLPPALDPIGAQTVAEGDHLEFRVSSSDPDGTTPSLSAVGLPPNSVFTDSTNGAGSLVFDPDFTQAGIYNVTVIASDGLLADSEVVAITVTNTNLPPVLDPIGAKIVAEGGHLEFRVSSSDPDATTPALTALSVPANATFTDSLNGAGSLVFDPDFTQEGVYNLTFIASDGFLADSEVVTITVTATNLPPVLDPVGAQSVAEGNHLEFRVSGSDPDLDSLILTALGVPVNASFADSGNGAAGFVFDPDFTQEGVYNVTFIISDAIYADTEIVAITVTNTNLPPVLDPIGAQSVDEGGHLEFRVTGSDPDGNIPVLTALGVPANALFTDSTNGAGSLIFDPDYSQAGVHNITIIASDGALADTEIVAITVNEVNPTPVLDPIGAKFVSENAHLEFRVTASDADGSIPALTAVNVPLNATFADSGNGAGGFVFDPDFTQEGVYNVTFIASDTLTADTEIVVITVSSTNRPPVANAGPDQGPLALGVTVVLDGTASSDPDLDSLGYHWRQFAGPAATLSDSNAAMPTFLPAQGGVYEFELLVDDGLAVSFPDSVSITIFAKPSAISDLLATINAGAVDLGWTGVTTDTSGAPTTVDHYIVYRGTRAYFTPTPAESIGVVAGGTSVFSDANIGGADVVGDTGTNYFYCVVAVDPAGSRSDWSNRVGEYDFQIYTTSTTDYSFITMPFAGTGITTASQLITAIGTGNVNAVSRFVAASQSYESRFAAGFGTNFAVVPGGVYQVNANTPTVFSIAGRVPDSGTVSYQIVTTSTTDYSFISIPFEHELTYTTAQSVISSMPGVLNALSRFVPASQSYESRFAAGFGPNFSVRPGRVYQANAATMGVFPAP